MMIQSKRSISVANRTKLDGSSKSQLLSLVVLVMLFLLPGCDKGPQADATVELAASFEDSPAKEDVIKANAAFEQRRYKDSLKLLHAVVSRGNLTERQKRAIAGLLGELLQAIHDDPQLSKDGQLHRMMELLVLRTMGET